MCLLEFLCALSHMCLENACADLLNSFVSCEMSYILLSRAFWKKEEKASFFIPIMHRANSEWSSNEAPFRLNIRIRYIRIYVRVM